MKKELTVAIEIKNLIYSVRQKQVMLDRDLAYLYDVETKYINRAVKRNIDRFPKEFMFQLNQKEWSNLKFQFGTSSSHGGRRTLPYAFTEQGVAMLSAVLKSDRAVTVSVDIMNAFVEMRKFITQNTQLFNRIDSLEYKQIHDKIELKTAHDRFLIVDKTKVYHFGASLKDVGKDWFAFSILDIDAKDILGKL